MARALPDEMKFVFRGDETGPSMCICDYVVEDGDLKESPALMEDEAPTTGQSVAAMLTGAVTTIKTNEGI